MQVLPGPWPHPPIALFGSRFEAGEHLLFFHRDRRKHGLVDPVVIALNDGSVAFGYPWAYLQGRELRRVELSRCSLLDVCDDVEDLDVLIVDDGSSRVEELAAAVTWVRRGAPHRLVVAVAVADGRLAELLANQVDHLMVGREVHHLQEGANAFAEAPTTAREAQAWLDDVNQPTDDVSPPRRPRRLHRTGLPWTVEDEIVLLHAFDSGTPSEGLGELLGRTAGAAESRLAQYGLVEHDSFRGDGRFVGNLRAGKVLARAWTRRNQVRAVRHLLRRQTPAETLAELRVLEDLLRPEPGATSTIREAVGEELVLAVDAAMDDGAGRSLDDFLSAHPQLEATP